VHWAVGGAGGGAVSEEVNYGRTKAKYLFLFAKRSYDGTIDRRALRSRSEVPALFALLQRVSRSEQAFREMASGSSLQTPAPVDRENLQQRIEPRVERVYLNCPFRQYGDRAWQTLGAKYDPDKKKWYVPPDVELAPFEEWRTEIADHDVFLNCPFEEKEAAKALGAKFNWDKKKWFVPASTNLRPFHKWLPTAAPARSPDARGEGAPSPPSSSAAGGQKRTRLYSQMDEEAGDSSYTSFEEWRRDYIASGKKKHGVGVCWEFRDNGFCVFENLCPWAASHHH